ncbi:pirin family protein [Streptomyces sp. TG1A-8]|uniref:pirin family protein n=1 Tax=Streptomyces sp. TG1A-8 TaxID=3051385 RepID=UPI003464E43F
MFNFNGDVQPRTPGGQKDPAMTPALDVHSHQDMEIVTRVLVGALVRRDSEGRDGVIHPGPAQRASAGIGILHSERNGPEPHRRTRPRTARPLRGNVGRPDEAGIRPGCEQFDLDDELARGGRTTLASGMPRHPDRRVIGIRHKHAAPCIARIRPTQTLAVADTPLDLFAACGSADPEEAGALRTGNAVARLRGGGPAPHGGPDGAEVLLREMNAALTTA